MCSSDLLGIGLSHLTNYWFPWLIIVTGQIPCALLWRLVTERRDRATARTITGGYPTQKVTPVNPPTKPVSAVDKIFPFATEELMPDVPEYDLVGSPIGEGSFGKVWLVRNAIGQWQALKVIYQSKFGDNTKPFEAELQGLMRYKPVSELHPGLLRIELVSRKKPEGYFYYVMELGDSETPGWQQDPSRYRARDLETVRDQAPNRCLPVSECLRLAIILADALDFLHRQGLTHRDIKPANVIFVNGRPKLADIGLVANVRPVDEAHTQIGTPGYMPPPPEPAGTIRADIYALGMVLYVIGTGKDPAYFPEISTTLIETSGNSEFLRLNDIILTACQPDPARRYQTTADMLKALREAAKKSSPA